LIERSESSHGAIYAQVPFSEQKDQRNRQQRWRRHQQCADQNAHAVPAKVYFTKSAVSPSQQKQNPIFTKPSRD
jgi:hypothetical protein